MASKTLASLVVKIGADVTGVTAGLNRTKKEVSKLEGVMGRAGTAVLKYGGTMAALAGGAALGAVIRSSIESQKVTAQLAAVIKSTGGAAGRTIGDLEAYADAIQKTTVYGDEATHSVQAMLLTFTSIKGGVFDQATETILNMATAMAGGGVATEGDLKSASIDRKSVV